MLPSSVIIESTIGLLLLLSVLAWTVIFIKSWQQIQVFRWNQHFLRRFWGASNLQAITEVASLEGPLARVCKHGLDVLQEVLTQKHQDLQHSGDRQNVLERALRQQVQMEQSRLERGFTVLASVGSTAPFIGLFGTVWGIMEALEKIGQTGSAGIDVVAGPISEALMTTALGIATAVPAVLAYNYFLRRLRVQVTTLENFATDFLHLTMKAHFDGKA